MSTATILTVKYTDLTDSNSATHCIAAMHTVTYHTVQTPAVYVQTRE